MEKLELADTIPPSPPPPPPPKRYPLSIADLGAELDAAIVEVQRAGDGDGRPLDRTGATKLLLAMGAQAWREGRRA